MATHKLESHSYKRYTIDGAGSSCFALRGKATHPIDSARETRVLTKIPTYSAH
jgi:hypothetical protein